MKVLVLGGSYFVGRAIVESLGDRGASVYVLNRGSKPLPSGVLQITCDRKDKKAFAAAVDLSIYDAIVDVSGYDADDLSFLDNRGLTTTGRYIYISSAAVYVQRDAQGPFREDELATGDAAWSDYGRGKSICESRLIDYGLEDLIILRPPYIYGPNNYLDRETFVYSRLMKNVPIFVPSNGEVRIQFCYVHDLAMFVSGAIVDRYVEPGTYNIGEDKDYSFIEWINLIGEVVKREPRVRLVTASHYSARDYFPFRNVNLTLDVSRFVDVAAYPPTGLRLGLEETFQQIRNAGTPIVYRPSLLERQWISEEKWT